MAEKIQLTQTNSALIFIAEKKQKSTRMCASVNLTCAFVQDSNRHI
jgi:hypothetical protein